MKRLQAQPFDASHEAWCERREANAAAWQKEETWWRLIGIEPRHILLRLR